ncbi:class I SAM-dependent DNA methyltransferase [Roseobacter sinensis]|uniref:Methyltransferase domain-containing protein n=1 Tax=Roseobacter sinensis TaxID=2931391 RepID=A0ABT3BBJ6_9RHOB|nr:methyltransferase domain-containing protein [Roseobacter sp. WL0113]MCV3270958.1 methyltransferase domain-containing protein [Roseobacter sp. WL0113]
MGQEYLDKVYDARDPQETRALYDAWSASYEAEVGKNGYVTPSRAAHALAKFTKDQAQPVLDFGCGTGLSGLALKLSGFETIDGVDLSPDMLAQAEERRLYRRLTLIEPDGPLPVNLADYAAVAAIGVIGAGAAPISVFDDLMHGLRRGGLLVLSLNDHALQDRANEARICEWVDCAAARLLFRENGPHLPGINLNSNVYVLEKN